MSSWSILTVRCFKNVMTPRFHCTQNCHRQFEHATSNLSFTTDNPDHDVKGRDYKMMPLIAPAHYRALARASRLEFCYGCSRVHRSANRLNSRTSTTIISKISRFAVPRCRAVATPPRRGIETGGQGGGDSTTSSPSGIGRGGKGHKGVRGEAITPDPIFPFSAQTFQKSIKKSLGEGMPPSSLLSPPIPSFSPKHYLRHFLTTNCVCVCVLVIPLSFPYTSFFSRPPSHKRYRRHYPNRLPVTQVALLTGEQDEL